jgi:hypothetical protein
MIRTVIFQQVWIPANPVSFPCTNAAYNRKLYFEKYFIFLTIEVLFTGKNARS